MTDMLTPMTPWQAVQESVHADVYFNLDDGRQVFLVNGNRSATNVLLKVEDGHFGSPVESVIYRPDAVLYCKIYR